MGPNLLGLIGSPLGPSALTILIPQAKIQA